MIVRNAGRSDSRACCTQRLTSRRPYRRTSASSGARSVGGRVPSSAVEAEVDAAGVDSGLRLVHAVSVGGAATRAG